jgi:hypothetical protein
MSFSTVVRASHTAPRERRSGRPSQPIDARRRCSLPRPVSRLEPDGDIEARRGQIIQIGSRRCLDHREWNGCGQKRDRSRKGQRIALETDLVLVKVCRRGDITDLKRDCQYQYSIYVQMDCS